jgi:hypothetical protein
LSLSNRPSELPSTEDFDLFPTPHHYGLSSRYHPPSHCFLIPCIISPPFSSSSSKRPSAPTFCITYATVGAHDTTRRHTNALRLTAVKLKPGYHPVLRRISCRIVGPSRIDNGKQKNEAHVHLKDGRSTSGISRGAMPRGLIALSSRASEVCNSSYFVQYSRIDGGMFQMTALYQSHTSHFTASAGSITGETCVELERNGVSKRAGQGERKRRRGKGEKGDERRRKNCLGPGEVAGHSVYISLTTKSTTFGALQHMSSLFLCTDTTVPVYQ